MADDSDEIGQALKRLEGLNGLGARECAHRLIEKCIDIEPKAPWEIAQQTPEQYYGKVVTDLDALRQICEGKSADPTTLSPAEVLSSLTRLVDSTRWLLQKKELKNLHGLALHFKALVDHGDEPITTEIKQP